jgi:protein-S-isoprenylcysteine O-methyltransferase Ste14
MSDMTGYTAREKFFTISASLAPYPFVIATIWVPLKKNPKSGKGFPSPAGEMIERSHLRNEQTGDTMHRIMQKSAMAISAMIVAISGLAIAGPGLFSPFIIILISFMLAWAVVELYIGFSRPLEGIVPSGPVIKVSRMLWLPCAVYSWLDFRNGWTRIPLPSWVSVLLLALCFAALVLRVWAVSYLGKSFTYDVKRPTDNVLIQTGPYRFVRHPGYLGIIILATLPGLIVGSIAGSIGLLLATLTQTIMRMRAEERMLEEEFGETFREYRQNTYRLLPFVY